MSWAWKQFYYLGAWPRGNKTFFMLNSAEHEIYQMKPNTTRYRYVMFYIYFPAYFCKLHKVSSKIIITRVS